MDKELIEIQKEMMVNFLSDVNSIPDFINCKKFTHKRCFDISTELFISLRRLIESQVITDSELKKITSNIFNYINDMFDVEPLIGLEYFVYIGDLTKFYMNQCVQFELYESADNLNKFLDLYNKIKK